MMKGTEWEAINQPLDWRFLMQLDNQNEQIGEK